MRGQRPYLRKNEVYSLKYTSRIRLYESAGAKDFYKKLNFLLVASCSQQVLGSEERYCMLCGEGKILREWLERSALPETPYERV